MPDLTTRAEMPKVLGSENARDYLKGASEGDGLHGALDTLDAHAHDVDTGDFPPVKRIDFGTFAARPAAGNAGHVYFATDTELLYADNGTDWVQATGASLGANTFTGIQRWAEGAQVASAATITLGTDGNSFDITGTTQTTSITAVPAGTVVYLTAVSAGWRLTHGSNLSLKGGYDFWSEVGSMIALQCYDGVNWRELSRTHPTEAASHQLTGAVTMTNANTGYDGPSVASLPAGTWQGAGKITVSNATAGYCTARIWDGTTTQDEAEGTIDTNGNNVELVCVTPIFTLTAATTMKMTAYQTQAGGSISAATAHNSAGGNKAGTLTFRRVA